MCRILKRSIIVALTLIIFRYSVAFAAPTSGPLGSTYIVASYSLRGEGGEEKGYFMEKEAWKAADDNRKLASEDLEEKIKKLIQQLSLDSNIIYIDVKRTDGPRNWSEKPDEDGYYYAYKAVQYAYITVLYLYLNGTNSTEFFTVDIPTPREKSLD